MRLARHHQPTGELREKIMNACRISRSCSLSNPISLSSFRGFLAFEKTLFVAVNVMDVVMTYRLLNTGSFYECNPIANFVIGSWGMTGMTMFKLMVIASVLAIVNLVAVWRPETSRRLLYFGTAIVGSVVAYSSYLMMSFQGLL
jgi:hypothetical protein